MNANVSPIARDVFAKYLNDIFFRAFRTHSFDAICTILRVGSMQDESWDPFQESISAFMDFNWLLEKAMNERAGKCSTRVALLMYCQAVEMTAPHEMISNLLRCIAREPYIVKPFGHLEKTKKKQTFSWIPPSATTKFRELTKQAIAANELKLVEHIDAFFDDRVRNAFSHSDYILTDTTFRWTEGGQARQIDLDHLCVCIDNCFAFYGALLWCHSFWLRELANLKRYHQQPNYEVLELLSRDNGGVYGFNIHFSNGQKATYTRSPTGTDATNIWIEDDGSINFFCGDISALEPVWKVNGNPVINWEELNSDMVNR